MDSHLANLPYTEPATETQYHRAALTLARMAGGDTDGLREALEAIGHPAFEPAAVADPQPKPNYGSRHSGPANRCRRNLHDMTGSNVIADSSGRRCRKCRSESRRRRMRGEK